MSNQKPNILQDYGVQPNLKKKDESFIEFIQRTTWFEAMTKALQRHSEFMQPWKDDYPQMEYSYPHPFVPDTPAEKRTPEELGYSVPCIISCFAPLYCDEPVKCHMSVYQCPPGVGWIDCIAAQQWSAYAVLGGNPTGQALGLEVVPERVYPLEISAVGEWPSVPGNTPVNLIVSGRDAVGNVCETDVRVFCYDRSPCDCDEADTFEVDEANSDETIAEGGTATVTVTGGCPHYTWSVSGTGYSIVPDGASNLMVATVTSASGTCGTHYGTYATVTITDACGTSVTWVIRNTTDTSWKTCSSGSGNCGFPVSGTCDAGYTDIPYPDEPLLCKLSVRCCQPGGTPPGGTFGPTQTFTGINSWCLPCVGLVASYSGYCPDPPLRGCAYANYGWGCT